jgi:uncharacterized metal-binding protein
MHSAELHRQTEYSVLACGLATHTPAVAMSVAVGLEKREEVKTPMSRVLARVQGIKALHDDGRGV